MSTASLRQLIASPFLFAALGLARAMVLTMPFRFYAPLLGRDAPDSAAVSPPPPSEHGWRARRIGGLIEAVAQFTPWNSNCLAQTIVAALCLRALGIGYTVHFGVATNTGTLNALEAHSWVMAGEFPVTGFRESSGMTPVRTFRLGS